MRAAADFFCTSNLQSLSHQSHGGELRTQIFKSHLVRIQSLNVLPLRSGSTVKKKNNNHNCGFCFTLLSTAIYPNIKILN